MTTATAPDQKKIDAIAAFESRMADSKNALGETFRRFSENITFAFDEQWSKQERQNRTNDPNNPRPVLTFNKVMRIGKRISNDAKQASLGIKVVPVDNEADPLIAEVYNILIKKYEQDNNMVSVRQQGFEDALFGGFGFWRLYTDWDGPKSFDKKIIGRRLVNPRMVLWDKSSIEPDLSDSSFFIIYERKSKGQAKAEYPDFDWDNLQVPSDCPIDWIGKDEVLIAEQFCFEYRDALLINWNGTPLWEEELSEEQKALWDATPKDVKKANSRQTQKRVAMWYKLAGRDYLEEPQEWDGDELPVVFCGGREHWDGNKRYWDCITTMLKDPQVLYNLYRSTQAERLTIADDAPWLITLQGVAGLEDVWKRAHVNRTRYLPYNHKDEQGQELPPPQRTQPIVGDIGLDQEVARLDQEMLDISGVNLATLGESSGEKSGKAILARQKQGEMINADFLDNFALAMRREGKIVVDLIPRIYTWEKAMRVLGNEKAQLLKKLQAKGLFGWGNGKYDLEIEVGSASSTARADNRDFWQGQIQANPQIGPVVLPAIIEDIGLPKAKLIARRLEAMLPPNIQAIKDEDPEFDPTAAAVQQVQQQAQEAMQQMQQQTQQIAGQLQQCQAELQQVKTDKSADMERTKIEWAKLEIDRFNADTNRIKVEAEARFKAGKMLLEADNQEHDQKVDRVNATMAAADLHHSHAQDHKNTALQVYEATKPEPSPSEDESGTEPAESGEPM